MENNIFVENYVLAESLIKISYAIESLYHKLYKMEINGQRGSKEYKKYLDYLDMSLDYEEELYQDSKLNAMICRDLIYLIIKKYMNGKVLSDFESIIERKYENAYLRRVINKLTKIMDNDYSGMHELMMNDIFEIKENGDIDYTYFNKMICNNLMNDFVDRILLILQEKIDETNDIKLKSKLIRDKYFISFIFSNQEKGLVKNEFLIDPIVTDNAKMISYASAIDKYFYESIKSEYLIKEIRKLVYKTLFKYHNEKNNSEKAFLRECFIRAIMMLMDEKLIDEFNLEVNGNLNIGCDNLETLINKCIEKNKKDKEKQITIKAW